MKPCAPTVLSVFAAGLVWGACGSGGGSGPLPMPSPPVVPQQQPPDFDVSGPWNGSDSDSAGSGAIDLFLGQDGGVVSGGGGITEDRRRTGFFAGTLSGSTLSFNFNYGGNCIRKVSGTLAVGPNSMKGTFNGTNSCGGTIDNGQVSLTSGRPDLTGTWAGEAPSIFGAGTWRWVVQQYGTRISAMVTIATNNLHETDSLQGVMFYAVGNPGLSLTLVLSSPPCSGVSVAVTPLRDAPPPTATQISGLATVATGCLGPSPTADFVLTKQ